MLLKRLLRIYRNGRNMEAKKAEEVAGGTGHHRSIEVLSIEQDENGKES
jgi:hypothetical protein